MLAIFRKIRRRLLSKNRFTGYLAYALGEIVLVVAGILIALQINTWSKERANRKLEVTYLNSLIEDLQIQTEILDAQREQEEQVFGYAAGARKYFEGEVSTELLVNLLDSMFRRKTFVTNKATFDDLNSTGNFSLIRGQKLRESLVRYYQRLDYVSAVVNNNNIVIIDGQFGQFLSNNRMEFEMDANGKVMEKVDMTPDKRFLLDYQVNKREGISQTIYNFCTDIRDQTEELIGKLVQEVERLTED